MKLIGYIFIIIANVVLRKCGIDFTMWEWWVITLSFIIGECMVCWESRND